MLVEVRNSSDKRRIWTSGPRSGPRSRSAAIGWSTIPRTRFLLQANVLQVGRTSRAAAEGAFASGFGSAVIGGAAGAGLAGCER